MKKKGRWFLLSLLLLSIFIGLFWQFRKNSLDVSVILFDLNSNSLIRQEFAVSKIIDHNLSEFIPLLYLKLFSQNSYTLESKDFLVHAVLKMTPPLILSKEIIKTLRILLEESTQNTIKDKSIAMGLKLLQQIPQKIVFQSIQKKNLNTLFQSFLKLSSALIDREIFKSAQYFKMKDFIDNAQTLYSQYPSIKNVLIPYLKTISTSFSETRDTITNLYTEFLLIETNSDIIKNLYKNLYQLKLNISDHSPDLIFLDQLSFFLSLPLIKSFDVEKTLLSLNKNPHQRKIILYLFQDNKNWTLLYKLSSLIKKTHLMSIQDFNEWDKQISPRNQIEQSFYQNILNNILSPILSQEFFNQEKLQWIKNLLYQNKFSPYLLQSLLNNTFFSYSLLLENEAIIKQIYRNFSYRFPTETYLQLKILEKFQDFNTISTLSTLFYKNRTSFYQTVWYFLQNPSTQGDELLQKYALYQNQDWSTRWLSYYFKNISLEGVINNDTNWTRY